MYYGDKIEHYFLFSLGEAKVIPDTGEALNTEFSVSVSCDIEIEDEVYLYQAGTVYDGNWERKEIGSDSEIHLGHLVEGLLSFLFMCISIIIIDICKVSYYLNLICYGLFCGSFRVPLAMGRFSLRRKNVKETCS